MNAIKLPKELTTITPLSKTLAALLFILLPAVSFVAGMYYQATSWEIFVPPYPIPTRFTLSSSSPSPIPLPKKNCTSDADCPTGSTCYALAGMGVVSSNGGKSMYTITQGQCRSTKGNGCQSDADCMGGLLCRNATCQPMQMGSCNGLNDTTSCPAGYTCVAACGPPVIRFDQKINPTYFCRANELLKRPMICPV